MKIKKTSLISYLLIISLLLTSVSPAFAQAGEERVPDEITSVIDAVSPAETEEAPSEYDPSNPDSILYGSDIDETYDEQTEEINENIEQHIEENALLAGDTDEASEVSESTEDTGNNEDEGITEFEDVSHMSDEEFFGVWDKDTENWTTEGKINYDYSPELMEVEEMVKANRYYAAKIAMLNYYKNRTNIPRADFNGTINTQRAFTSMIDTYIYSEGPLNYTNITNTDEYVEYTIDLLTYKSAGPFLLTSLNKTTDIIEIASRETAYSPSLLLTKKDGTNVTLYPIKDTYIRGYDDKENYGNEIYGKSKKLYVKDSYYEVSDGQYKPYSSKTRRTYIQFDSNKIPSDVEHAYLKIYAKIIPEEGIEQTTDDNLELYVFNSYNKSWDEYEELNNLFKPMTWNNYKIAHYSWNGIPGGFDWKTPDNVPSEWINTNTRFMDIESMTMMALESGNEEFMIKSITDVLDFINDTNGKIQIGGVPPTRDLESYSRCVAMPGVLSAYLDSDMINGEALCAILKWIWEEMTYLYNGAGCLFSGATDIPQSNNYAETNRGFWNVEAMDAICCYFPEYSDKDMWKTLVDKRLETVIHVILNDDGCYQESSFSYPVQLLGDFIDLWKRRTAVGEDVPDWYIDRVKKFAYYIIQVCFPNGAPSKYGEGSVSASDVEYSIKKYVDLIDDEIIEYIYSDGKEGTEPETSSFFEKLNIALCRTDWSKDASMLMISAKNGGNHNHKDSMHITYYSNGRFLLDDTGMTSYDSDHPHFQWQRHTTRSHNTIEIDKTPQRGSNLLYNSSSNASEKNGEASLNLHQGKIMDQITAWTDATKGFRHHRNVSFIKKYDFLIVSDMVRPEDEAVHSYTQNWHTYAGKESHAEIDSMTNMGRTNYEYGPNVNILQVDKEDLSASLETGYSADNPQPTKYFCYTKKTVGDVSFNTIIYPQVPGDSVKINAEKIDTGEPASVATAIDINYFKNHEDMLNIFYYNTYDTSPVERSFDKFTTDASTAVVMQNIYDMPEMISMFNGTKLIKDKKEIIVSDVLIKDIEIEFDGAEAKIISIDENILSSKLTFRAPYKIKKVTINGEEVDFVYSSNKVYVNNHEAVDFSTDSGYLIRQTAENSKGDRFGVVFDIPKDSVTNGSLSYPSVTYSNNAFNVSFGSGVLSSSAKITFAGHTGKNVVATIDGVKENITNKIKVGSTREEADSRVVPGAPVIERAREDLVIWTKDIADFKIGAAAVSEGFGGGGNAGSPGVKPLPPAGSDTVGSEGGDKVSNYSSSGDTGLSGGKGSSSHGGTAFVPVDTNIGFEDCKNHWAKDDIAYMYAKGFVNGISETAFAPDRNVTRAEFAAMAVRVLGIEATEFSGAFDDVTEGDWYSGSVEAAYRAELIQGFNGLFRPDDNITREEMAVILMRVYRLSRDYTSSGDITFTDSAEISSWAIDAVKACCEIKLINGMGDGRFAPKSNTTRAQAAVVFKRLAEK